MALKRDDQYRSSSIVLTDAKYKPSSALCTGFKPENPMPPIMMMEHLERSSVKSLKSAFRIVSSERIRER